MKHNYYIVTFTNGKTVFATCSNPEDAEILGMAAMIRNGFSKTVKSVRKADGIAEMRTTNFVM